MMLRLSAITTVVTPGVEEYAQELRLVVAICSNAPEAPYPRFGTQAGVAASSSSHSPLCLWQPANSCGCVSESGGFETIQAAVEPPIWALIQFLSIESTRRPLAVSLKVHLIHS